MVRSMTGFGSGQRSGPGIDLFVEVKAVNGRFLKLSVRSPACLSSRESEIEALVKKRLARGSLTATIRVRRTDPEKMVTVDEAMVRAYQSTFRRLGLSEERIPTLPGVLGSIQEEQLSAEEWRLMRDAVEEAVEQLVSMRLREGAGLRSAVEAICQRISDARQEVLQRAPKVVEEYRAKLTARLAVLLDESMPLDEQQLAREVALYADRADITEEVERLGVHLQHVMESLASDGEVGRSLDFLAQEMLREVNTIGSKSADAQLARLVVGLKSEVERVKEQVANIE